MRWKVDPASESHWRGQDGTANTNGFNMFTDTPPGVPAPVQPNDMPNPVDYCKHLLSKKVKKTLTESGLKACIDANYQSALTGIIPVHRYLEDATPVGEWGRLCTIGAVEGKRGKVRFVDKPWSGDTRETMWAVPASALGNRAAHASNDHLLVDSSPLPMLRYSDQRPDQCPVASHPNNAAHPLVVRRQSRGRWVEDDDGTGHRFELDFEKGCKVGEMCVSRGVDEDTGEEYVQVGMVRSITDRARGEFTATLWAPVGEHIDSKEEACLDAKWAPTRTTETMRNFSQIVYFKRMKNTKKLPKRATDAVKNVNLAWREPS